MNTPVSFELAKLLKEKGFKPTKLFGYISKFYNPNTKTLLAFGRTGKTDLTKAYYAPTIVDVVMWLYEKHGIWVSVDWMKRIKPYNSGFYCHLRGTNKSLNRDNFIVINDTLNPGYEVFNSPTEAYEDAIEYILNNLI